MNYKNEWEDSYGRGENRILYPKEEIVKFLNRFIRKKIGPERFLDKIKITACSRALDLGCGIGTQTELLREFGFLSYGADITEKAISFANEYYPQNKYVLLGNQAQLPFDDDFFSIAICDSVLDSMPFEIAKKYMDELERTVTDKVFLNLIYSPKGEEVIVEGQHELGTIQSYFSNDKFLDLIATTSFRVCQMNLNTVSDLLTNKTSQRWNIVLTKL